MTSLPVSERSGIAHRRTRDPADEGHGYDHLVDSWSVGVIVFSMLTNCTPFLEDDQLPMSERIRKRKIEWGCLGGQGKCPPCTLEAKNFIERLLNDLPGTRMSLTEALDHPWLTDRHMDSQPDSYSQQSVDQHALASDVSMLTSFPSSPPFTPAPSQRLARRADVNARAAEEQEMARQKAESESSRGTSPGMGEKRGREFTGNGYAGNGAPSSNAAMEDDDGPLGAVRSPAKRGRMDVDEVGGAGRKTRAPASRTTHASAVPPSVEAEPRWSPRVTKTAARR